jgi:hypothetical protein
MTCNHICDYKIVLSHICNYNLQLWLVIIVSFDENEYEKCIQ